MSFCNGSHPARTGKKLLGNCEPWDHAISRPQMKEKPYIDLIRRSSRYGPQGFIKDLDTHAKVKIAHKIAFNVYRFENFEHLWSREWVVEEPELELAARGLQKGLHASRSRSRAEAMIRVWWLIHNIEDDEFALLKAVD